MKAALSALTVLLFLAPRAALEAADPPKPNVVIIMADDLGYADLGCYGATKIATPNADRLAREGRRFTDAHTPSAVCSPTRFGLLTGGYPWRGNRVPRHLEAGESLVIRDGEPTLPGLLKSAGYATGCVGKWHLGVQRKTPIDWNAPLKPGPNDVGFDEYFGVINSHNQAPFVLVENDKILGLKPGDRITIEGNNKQTAGPLLRDENALEARQTEKAVGFIERHRDKPFFLYYPTAAVHDPVTPGKAWQGKSKAGPYGDYVQEFDAAVGAVLEALDRLKLADNTIVIVTSDNGGIEKKGAAFGHRPTGRLRGGKGTAWEGGHRVPFLVRWPGQVPAGTTCDETCCHVDVMATVCEALGIALPANAGPDSFSMLKAWRGEKLAKPVREGMVSVAQHAAVFSLRQGPWKLHLDAKLEPDGTRTFTPTGLYNLAEDPVEKDDRAGADPTRVKAMQETVQRYQAERHTRPGWKN